MVSATRAVTAPVSASFGIALRSRYATAVALLAAADEAAYRAKAGGGDAIAVAGERDEPVPVV